STIIPVHNRPLLLREAVASVLVQTYRPIEIVIVDDGSTDDTAQSIAALAAGYPSIVRHLRIPNGGPGAAREAGRGIANGELSSISTAMIYCYRTSSSCRFVGYARVRNATSLMGGHAFI